MTKKKIIITITSIILGIAYILYFIYSQGNLVTAIVGLVFLIIYLTSKKEKTVLFITGGMADDNPKTDSEEFNDQSFRQEPVGNILYLSIAIVFLIISVIF